MDPYAILGLNRNCSKEEISKAYRKLAVEWHPDRNPDPEAKKKFSEIAQAFEILNDDEKRSQYDKFGSVGPQSPHQHHHFHDIFSHFFRDSPSWDDEDLDINAVVEINLLDVINGCEKIIEVTHQGECQHCAGTGAENKEMCYSCKGKGFRVIRQGPMVIKSHCDCCGGMGKNPCHHCKGNGYSDTNVKKKITVKIPPGANDGNRLTLRGQGKQSANGQGDINVFIKVKKDKNYEQDGEGNLHIDLPVSYTQLIFGDKISFNYLDNKKISVNIPAKTSSGKILKLNSLGLPILRANNRGNLYVHILLEPISELKINNDYKEVLNKLKEFENKYPSEKRKTFSGS